MSVGGRVVETILMPGRVWVNTREPQSGDLCAIYVESTPAARCITEGDSVWWQGQRAFWTPRAGSFRDAAPFSDMSLRRIGCSGISRQQAVELKAELECAASETPAGDER